MNGKKSVQKIAFVCQRYGLEVNGGSELYCRQVAERLVGVYDVTIYTTCALDYVTWANHYPAGIEEINGVHVRRFVVSQQRRQGKFSRLCDFLTSDRPHTDAQEAKWVDMQGPVSPELLEALRQEHDRYAAVLFMTYLYYPTAVGIQMGFDNAILIPTVHDEPWVYFRYFDKVFAAAKAIAWNTPEEQAFAYRRFPFIADTPCAMTGIGIDEPRGDLPEISEQLRGKRYIVYAGRIDESKGCGEMFDFYLRYKKTHGDGIKLVLMGKEVMHVPRDPDIVKLGFVSEEMKYAVMAQAVALVLHSRFESLSMVLLESMMMGRPVLVTAHCQVLVGHCVRSNAGLYFRDYPEFAAMLDYMLNHPAQYSAMRKNGRKYVEENYHWDVIVQRYSALIEGLRK